ncbi:MAG: tyrosine-type recombinase/integrase [Acidobacteriaceae bacterium]
MEWKGKRCEKCGGKKRKYEGLIPHDFRRSAARNLRKAGVPENVIMAVGGWKTRSMFDRYAIVNNDDTLRAMQSLEQARAAAKADPLNDPQEEKLALEATVQEVKQSNEVPANKSVNLVPGGGLEPP